MIVYKSTKSAFLDDILSNNIENIILESFKTKLGHTTSKNEISSWKNSMMYMNTVLCDSEISDDAGVAIEYQIPQTSKRIDFIITGKNENNIEHAVLIELKQWSEATLTEKDAIVVTYVGGTEREVSHPSYQAWSYATFINGFNQTVQEDNIQLKPCAYLHNYEQENVLTNEFYFDYIEKAPLFLKKDALKLRSFIKSFIKYGDNSDILFRIDNGKIKPSKNLTDSLSSMIKGNQEFVMIDEQKVVYESAISLARKSSEINKNVLIVEGGPGTGKSVVAINLLVAINKLGLASFYVTKNAAPRAVFESLLTGTMRKSEISNLFSGSGSFTETKPNTFGALIVDEAHRLNAKSGIYKNKGENQVKELINSSAFTIFFIDEDQKVTFSDIGEKEVIISYAKDLNAKVQTLDLTSQFRCNGSDGYISWLDDVLQIKETANTSLGIYDYEFEVFDNPNELKEFIIEKNKEKNKARLVAGYCWKWLGKKDKSIFDINIPEFKFGMKWNLSTDGSLWIISPESVNEIGCIHTCQGLEVDYVGVIIGLDLIVRDGKVITVPSARASTDSSLRGYKKLLKEDPEAAIMKADKIIKNTYRTLMTRGMKGCYIFSVDKETNDYFKRRLNNNFLI